MEVAVRDAAAASRLFATAFATSAADLVTEPTPGLELTMSSVPLADARLGVIEDASGQGPIARFLERRGEGLYSVLIEVPNLRDAMRRMGAAGITFVSDEPVVLTDVERNGRWYRRISIAWTHPRSTLGVLLELQEREE